MIKLNDGTILRNLEEQVRENKEQIALHWNVDRVLADFGIRVRGTLPTKAALDQVPTADLQYGDAYFIGTAEPYDVWIWTRPDANAGEEEPYWLDIGHIAIEGPQGPMGPQGPQGPQGERGATWYTGSSVSGTGKKDGDLWLYTGDNAETKGNIYKWSAASGSWALIANVIGPQGIQGPIGPQGPRGEQGPQGIQGPRGDSGEFINVRGILTNSNQLPTPASISDLSAAYLVGTAAPYNLYIQVGESSVSAVWTNSGLFNVGTLVTVNGEYQTTWDADTKVDKVTTVTTRPQLYMKNPDGTNKTVDATTDAGSNTIPLYSPQGKLSCTAPTANSHTVNKAYADANYVPVPALSGPGRYRVTGMGKNSTGDLLTSSIDIANYGTTPTNQAFPRGSIDGNITVANPVNATDAVNKQYADANFVKVPAYGNATGAIIRYSDGSTTGVNVAPAGQVSVSGIVRYSSTGTLAANNPVKATDVVNKQYIDGLIRKPVTIYLNLGGADGSVSAGVLGISAQLTPAEITALKAGIASDAEDMTPRITALFNYMVNNRYTMDYLALPVNGNIMTTDNSYYLSGGIHMDSLTTLKIRSGFGSEQQEPQYLQVDTTDISRVRLIVHIPNDPDDESP